MHSILRIGCTYWPSHSTWQETEIDNIHQLVVGATENVKEGNEDIREVKNKLIYSYFMFSFICTVKCHSLLLSQGNQKQRWLPGMDPVLPGHVLFLSPLPGLVWQLTQQARIDSIRQESVRFWHILVISLKGEDNTEMECTADHAGPGVRSNKVFLIKIIQVEVAVYSSLMLTIYFHV